MRLEFALEVSMNLKRQLKKTRSILSVTTYKRPRVMIILNMVLINIAILLLAAFIAQMIDDSFTSYLDALANGSVKWLLSPNAILAITNPKTLFLAVTVLIVGLVLFSGTIIALTTNAIKDYFQKKETNSGKIYLENHIVILNWNNKVPELVSDLLYLEEEHLTVIILSELDKSWIEKHLLNILRTHQSKLDNLSRVNLLVKQGNPLLKNDLDDISIEEARSIIVMNKDASADDLKDSVTESDLNVMKIILGLGECVFKAHPTIVVEVKRYETKEKILDVSKIVSKLHDKTIIPVCFDRRLGQIIAQTILDGRIDDVYLSLFSFKGSEVYRVPEKTFDDVLVHHSHAIPLAQEGHDVYVLSESSLSSSITSSHMVTPKEIKTIPFKEKQLQDIVIVGSNNKLGFIVESFKAYEGLHQSQFLIKQIPNDRLMEYLPSIESSTRPTTMLLLSDESVKSESLDANVISTLIDLKRSLKRDDIHIIIELLDPKNDRLIADFDIDKTIISNKMISLLLSKLALHPETATFYDQLLTIAPSEPGKDDYALTVLDAHQCFKGPFPIRFDSLKQSIHSTYLSYDRKAILCGIFRDEKLILFSGDLHANIPFELKNDDGCIFMKL